MKPEIRKTPDSGWRRKLHEIIFEADTAGRAFDVILILAIILSVLV